MNRQARPAPRRAPRSCATPDCGRAPQRSRPYCWSCDPAVPEEQKRAARAARWRGHLVAPDFQTIGSRVRFREAVAEATMEGELIPPVAAISLKAVNDAGEDLFRDKTGLPTGAGGFVIERVVFAARPVSVTAGPAPEVPTVRVVDAPVSMPVAPTVSPPQLSPPRNEAEVLIERFSRAASAASPEAADAG